LKFRFIAYLPGLKLGEDDEEFITNLPPLHSSLSPAILLARRAGLQGKVCPPMLRALALSG
jgi:hypothetical protein